MQKSLQKIANYLVEKPEPPVTIRKVVQIFFTRTSMERALLRTEEDRLNSVYLPLTDNPKSPHVRRIAFLAEKQKAVEGRAMRTLLQTAADLNEMKVNKCYYNEHLCMECPACVIYGAASTEDGKENNINIKHRIAYSDSVSLLPADQVIEELFFNGVDDRQMNCGQSFKNYDVVKPGTVFPSVVTLYSVTEKELVLVLKTLMGIHKYGASTRVMGRFINEITGVAAGLEEFITSPQYTMALSGMDNPLENIRENTRDILLEYKQSQCCTGDYTVILEPNEVESLVEYARTVKMDKRFLKSVYTDAGHYRKVQKSRAK
jgi:CRISPR-associated protein Csc2